MKVKELTAAAEIIMSDLRSEKYEIDLMDSEFLCKETNSKQEETTLLFAKKMNDDVIIITAEIICGLLLNQTITIRSYYIKSYEKMVDLASDIEDETGVNQLSLLHILSKL